MSFQGGTKNALCFELCVFNMPNLHNVGGAPPPFVTGFEGTIAQWQKIVLGATMIIIQPILKICNKIGC